MDKIKQAIMDGETYLGIELGSTRIKAVLTDKAHNPIASGSHNWENRLEGDIWTYSLDDVWTGLKDCYADLSEDVVRQYGVELEQIKAIGISAMMHGYMAFGKDGELLVPFRTWRNTTTGEAAEKLGGEFGFNIPQRWSIAHLYQAVLNEEPHVKDISYLTTLSGYIHWQLTGQKVLGVGDASGMFPIDDATGLFDEKMIGQFDALVADKNFPWKVKDILPEVLSAGQSAGTLTQEGAKLLDPTGKLAGGIPMCPPEGDAGTGMVATNAVKERTGNVSAGTSIFAMVVLEKPLSKVYPEIDMVTTPSGEAVAMVHCNNCLGDIDEWVKLMGEAAKLFGAEFDINTLYSKLYNLALEGDVECSGMLAYNYISGEPVTGFTQGRPLFVRMPDADMNLAGFIRTHLYSTCASLKIGMKILSDKEDVAIDSLTGHGGFFKQAYVGQRIMSAAMNTKVTVMETAGEGGPWGIAVLASYMLDGNGKTLAQYLAEDVFADAKCETVEPDKAEAEGFERFLGKYIAALPAEQSAVDSFS